MNTPMNETGAGMRDESLLKIHDVARYLNVSERHVRNLMGRRLISYMRIGGALRFDPQSVRDAALRLRVESK